MRYNGGGGACHEVAKREYAQGFSHRNVGQRRNRPEGATEFCGFVGMSRLLILDSAWSELDDQTFFRAPFQGAVMMVVNPGLKSPGLCCFATSWHASHTPQQL